MQGIRQQQGCNHRTFGFHIGFPTVTALDADHAECRACLHAVFRVKMPAIVVVIFIRRYAPNRIPGLEINVFILVLIQSAGFVIGLLLVGSGKFRRDRCRDGEAHSRQAD